MSAQSIFHQGSTYTMPAAFGIDNDRFHVVGPIRCNFYVNSPQQAFSIIKRYANAFRAWRWRKLLRPEQIVHGFHIGIRGINNF